MNLNQVTVPVSNVPQSILFYQKLGLKLIVHTHNNYARFECPIGDATFSIHTVSNFQRGNETMVYFECDELDEKVQRLIDSGLKFIELPNDKPWLWREAHLKDPDGNSIILYHAGENRKNPPWRLDK